MRLVRGIDFDKWFAGWDIEWSENVGVMNVEDYGLKLANDSSIYSQSNLPQPLDEYQTRAGSRLDDNQKALENVFAI
jgi:hypothetical protein